VFLFEIGSVVMTGKKIIFPRAFSNLTAAIVIYYSTFVPLRSTKEL